MKQKNNRSGFTLAELLIVVAIIAVLVAIAIPLFTNQLEKSRDATTVANLRSAYAEAQSIFITGGNGGTREEYSGSIEDYSTDDGKTQVYYNSNGEILYIYVHDVVFKGKRSGLSGYQRDLPFVCDDYIVNYTYTPGHYIIKFTYDAEEDRTHAEVRGYLPDH